MWLSPTWCTTCPTVPPPGRGGRIELRTREAIDGSAHLHREGGDRLDRIRAHRCRHRRRHHELADGISQISCRHGGALYHFPCALSLPTARSSAKFSKPPIPFGAKDSRK